MNKIKIMPELTKSEARRVKAAHILAGAGIVAVVATKLACTAVVSYRKGVRAGERRTLRRIAEGEAIEDIVAHKGGRRCCVKGHHHRGCCIHGDETMQDQAHHGMRGMMHGGMHGMMGGSDQAAGTDE